MEARKVTRQIEALALDLDDEIAEITGDPLATALYEYDGQFFTSRYQRVFHTAFNAFYLLKSLSDTAIRTFFTGRSTRAAIAWLLQELEKHRWAAKIRRMNWEEFGTLGLLPNEAIEEALRAFDDRRAGRADGMRPLSREEEIFFRSLGMDL